LLRSIIAFAAALAALPALHAADLPLVPIASFVPPDQFSTPRLSPDGKHIAITARIPKNDRHITAIMVYSLPTMKEVSASQLLLGEIPLSYTWVSNTRLVVEKGELVGSRDKPRSTGEVISMDLDGTKQEYLYGWQFERNSRHFNRYVDNLGWGYVSDVPRPLSGHFTMTTHTTTDVSMLYNVNAMTGTRSLLTTLNNPAISFVLQRNGKPRFAWGANNTKNEHILYRLDDKSDKWVELDGERAAGSFRPMAFSADDSEFLATVSPNGGPRQLVRENLATGARTTVMKDAVGSIDNFLWGVAQDLPFGASSSVGIPAVSYLNDASEEAKLHKKLSGKLAGHTISFINYTDDGSRLLFSATSDREPGSFFLYERNTGKAYPLFTTRELIDPAQMAERRPIKFNARDGLELHGYLTVPNNTNGKRPPLVLLPHGGPHGVADEWEFDNDAQFLASRGYAVLQVNFRGSGGRGSGFVTSGYRQWGGKIQEDLIDGVKWTIGQGLVDANRVCAYGVSFGAYSAMMVSIRAPELFKCAVGYAGVYDLKLLFQETNARKGTRLYNTYVDYVGTDTAELNRNSPAMLAAQLKQPVMLVHGMDDKIAPYEHAEVMRRALSKEGRNPEFMGVPDEGHGFYGTKNVTAFYEKLEVFLGKYLK
jgi:dienelactone hydrolase